MSPAPETQAFLRRYCFDCHGNDLAEAGVNLEKMTGTPDLGRSFKDWENVIRMLRERKMPPEYMPQPGTSQRKAIIQAIDGRLGRYIEQHEGDPGPVAMRRLTSAEYAYTIRDLTGLELKVAEDFVSDAVSGEGFTNSGGAQFMQDSTLERYLEAAKIVADHAVIGSGPLEFFADPGQTGRELSAITRIQRIYREHGFRTAAGEGAEPFGLDLYPRAMFVAWQYRHRDATRPRGDHVAGTRPARRPERAPVRAHLERPQQGGGAVSVVDDQLAMAVSAAAGGAVRGGGTRARCAELCDILREWQGTLAAAAGDEEEAAVLTAGEVQVAPKRSLTADINWPEGADVAEFELSVSRASKHPAAGAVVVWRNPRLRFRREDRRRDRHRPLSSLVAPETARRLAFGKHRGASRSATTTSSSPARPRSRSRLRIPEGMVSAQLFVDVELDTGHDASSIVRCRVADGEVAGETAAEVGATSTLLADPESDLVAEWREGVAEFARLLPEVSHREPAPSDRDPIPAPFDNTYNKPERNHFHSAIKYHRDDAFFVEHVADDATRRRLDQAWTDLLTSFEYHDANLRFVAKKFALDLGGLAIADLDRATIDRLPPGPRAFVQHLSDEFAAMQRALRDAEPGHVDDALRFAERCLASAVDPGRAAAACVRSTPTFAARAAWITSPPSARCWPASCVAPAFLYRVEPPIRSAGHRAAVRLAARQPAELFPLVVAAG